MPAVSIAQQRLFGQALAHKRGEAPDASEQVKKLADSMDEETLRHYAETKHEGLSEKQAAEAVDLDSTLAHHKPGSKFDPDHIGEPIPSMLRRVRNWLEQDKKVYILTARAANKANIPRIEEWLKEHGIGDCIVTNEKLPEMRRIWDNIAVAVEPNTGKVLADATKTAGHADKVIDGKTRWQRLYERRNPPPDCPECGKAEGEWLKEPGHCKCPCGHEYMDVHYAKGWSRPAAEKTASYEEDDLLSHVGKQASISKFKKALNEAVSKGQVPGDMPFYVKGDHCVVNAGDWHEREEIAAAVQLAEQHFDDVDEENECACPEDYDKVNASHEACTDGKIVHTIKEASQAAPTTGPGAIRAALAKLDLDKLEQEHRQYLKDGKVSKRQRAIQVLNAIEGLRRNNTNPEDLMISKVPVIPPAFRPFSVVGDSFVPGDANELYSDLFNVRSGHAEARKMFGESGVGQERLHLYDAVKALYGYGDPVNPKSAANGVSGFMRQVTGVSPKFSIVQRKLISKPMDSVARGVISIGADYGMDDIGVPRNQLWDVYKDYIQRRLVLGGMSSIEALRHIKERSPHAEKAMMDEITPNPATGWRGRPVIYARPPSWHKFNTLAGIPRPVDGDTIVINPYVTTGMTADFDGDTVTVHVPSLKESVDEAHDVLMPSKMLFSIRDQDKTMAVPKHEQVLSLFAAAHRPAVKTHQFSSKQEALAAIKANQVSLQDDIELPDPVTPEAQKVA